MLGLFLIISYGNKIKYKRTLIFCAFVSAFTSDSNLILHTKCPDCYNGNWCKVIDNSKIQLHWPSRVVTVINPEYSKSVFFATAAHFGEVVIKSTTKRGTLNSISSKYIRAKNITESIIQDHIFRSDDDLRNVIICPNIKSLSLILKEISKNLRAVARKKHLWLDLSLSIEPILLKFFLNVPNLNVPSIHGTCGDLVITEYKGNPLSDYLKSNWKQRLFLSFQLLEMADTLTFFHPCLVFYLTDISSDNIVVNSSGIISLIDLDNVIISERMGYQNYELLDDIHVSKVLDPLRMSFSPSDICGSSLSDHNYYAVCQYILFKNGDENSGLLRDVPEEVLDENPDFPTLLEECATPKIFANRIASGKYLKEILKDMVEHFELDQSF